MMTIQDFTKAEQKRVSGILFSATPRPGHQGKSTCFIG